MSEYSKKVIAVTLIVLSQFLSIHAQIPSVSSGRGRSSSTNSIYSPPKKTQIKSFAAKDFSFTIDFAGTPEKKADEINVVGLKIPMTSFKLQRESDYSFVEVYDFPSELKDSKDAADKLEVRIIKRFGATVSAENYIPAAEGAIKEIAAESEDVKVFFKIVAVRRLAYVIAAAAYQPGIRVESKQKAFSSEAKRFLNSFRFYPVETTQAEKSFADWTGVADDEQGFKVLMPTAPQKFLSSIATELDPIPVNNYISTPKSVFEPFYMYQVSVTKTPVAVTDEQYKEKLYDSAKRNALKGGKRLLSENDFFYRDRKGKQWITEDDKVIYHSRILYYDQKIFFLLIILSKPLNAPQELYNQAINKFYDSFEILEK